MTIELVPLCDVTVTLRAPVALGSCPSGNRLVFEVEGGTIKGERLSGSVIGNANADWLVVGADGTGTLDVRVLMETDDGATILIQYQGRVDLGVPGAHVYAAPRFDTGDERYAWLNKVQAAAKGTLDGQTLTYEMYELR
jgi:hypothetical protein